MSDLIEIDDQMPAYLRNTQPADNTALITSGGPTFPMISLKGSKFWLKKGDETKRINLDHLKLVIIAATPNSKLNAKTYYESDYISGETEAPDCSSSNGVNPDAHIAAPVSNMCATCPKNAWGSAKTNSGKDAKACRDVKMLYLVAPDKPDGDIVALRVPTMSLKHLSNYARELSRRSIQANSVITTIKFSDSEYPEIIFGFGGWLPEESYNKIADRIASSEVQDILEGTTGAVDGDAQVAPQPKAKEPSVSDDSMDFLDDVLDSTNTQTSKSTADTVDDGGSIDLDDDDDGIDPDDGDDGAAADVDATGRAWDGRIDSGNKKKSKKGKWMRRKNLSDEYYSKILAEHSTRSEPPAESAPSLFDDTQAPNLAKEPEKASQDSDLDDILAEWGS